MLVLSRKVGEKVLIDGGITIEVVEARPSGKVRLGITAPDGVAIVREELTPQAEPAADQASKGGKLWAPI